MRLLTSLVAAGLILSPRAAHAKDPPPVLLANSSNWEINYDDDSCHLLTRFGESDQAVTMRMTSFEPGDRFELRLISRAFRIKNPTAKLAIAFLPSESQPILRLAMVGQATDQRLAVLVSGLRLDGEQSLPENLPKVTPAHEAAITSIQFKLSGKTYRLLTGSMAKPMKAMRTCLNDLVKDWGFDPEVFSQLTRRAAPANKPGEWLTSSDYPERALSRGHIGMTYFRLDIDEVGKITACRVLFRTNPDDFSEMTCRLIKLRAKLSPALDSHGKPVRSFYIGGARWIM
jgi:hypothetical protein